LVNGQRIDSIDKINVRIKEILKSINDNELPSQKNTPKVNNNSDIASKLKPVESTTVTKLDYKSKGDVKIAPIIDQKYNIDCYSNISDGLYKKKDYQIDINHTNTVNNNSMSARLSLTKPNQTSDLAVSTTNERPLTFRYAGSSNR
jgi:hypothetical protein